MDRSRHLPIGAVTFWSADSERFLRGGILQAVTLLNIDSFDFLRDRDAIVDWLRDISPLSEDEMNRLMSRVVDTVSASTHGTVAVAALGSRDRHFGGLDYRCRCCGVL